MSKFISYFCFMSVMEEYSSRNMNEKHVVGEKNRLLEFFTGPLSARTIYLCVDIFWKHCVGFMTLCVCVCVYV